MKIPALFLLFFLSASANALRAQTYVLLPDSSLTIVGHSTSEALTGSFSWTFSSSDKSLAVFRLTSLSLASSSFSLSLNPANNEDPDTFSNGNTYFEGEVLKVGSGQNLEILTENNNGTFAGSFTDPTRVTYLQAVLIPDGGGVNLAFLNIDAEEVPEPSNRVLLLDGLGLLAFWRLCSRRLSQFRV